MGWNGSNTVLDQSWSTWDKVGRTGLNGLKKTALNGKKGENTRKILGKYKSRIPGDLMTIFFLVFQSSTIK